MKLYEQGTGRVFEFPVFASAPCVRAQRFGLGYVDFQQLMKMSPEQLSDWVGHLACRFGPGTEEIDE